MSRTVNEIHDRLHLEQEQEERQEREGDHRYFRKEKELEAKFDARVAKIAQKYGYDEIPWLDLTKGVLVVYTVLSILSMYYRPDFLGITVCALGIYVMENP